VTDLTDAQRLERARQASLALEHFLDPAFEAVVQAYSERLEQIASATPWEAAKITALANATRIAKEVRSQIAMLVADGADAKQNIDYAKKVETLTPAQRRFFNIAPR
jgi:hypothetical protein